MKKSLNMNHITMGVCYYPEHWGPKYWEADLTRMKELGIEVIRIAEFAWNFLEPEEGRYTLDYFEPVLKLAEKHGIGVIFCTPTATPPAWLSEKYPEILNANQEGVLFRHGMRQHHNMTSEIYLKYCQNIVERLAKHYSSFPAIIGWQIDNEVNCSINRYYSKSDHIAFRRYLKEKYKTLENLNEHIGADFWNQTYSDWEQVHLSRPTPSDSPNPHLMLEENHFIAHTANRYIRMQAEILKKYRLKEQFVTTNGIFGHVDYHELVEDESLDFITYDSYPNFAFSKDANPKKPGALNDRNTSFNLARTRSISPIFGIMEQQAGGGGWNTKMMQPAPKPGQIRLWTMQSVAHGADFVSYFRWRTSNVGTEIYWIGINDYSNQPNRRIEEIKGIAGDFKKIREVAGARCICKAAILKDYDNEFDAENDIFLKPLVDMSTDGWFRAFQHRHIPFDFYCMKDDSKLEELKNYELLVYPHPAILTQERLELLTAYVEAGGTLIFGARTGLKDKTGRCVTSMLPGLAAPLCGGYVEDYTCLGPNDEEETFTWGDRQASIKFFNDVLVADQAVVEGTYDQNYYGGAPALLRKDYGKGKVYYFGGGFGEDSAELFLDKIGLTSVIEDLMDLPKEIEVTLRRKDDQDYIFLLNYMPYAMDVNFKKECYDLLTNKKQKGILSLEAYGVMVLKI